MGGPKSVTPGYVKPPEDPQDEDELTYETIVRGTSYKEWEPVGTNAQPGIMTRRPFGLLDVYVQPEGQLALDYKLEISGFFNRSSQQSYLSILEFEFGLSHRLQVDVLFAFKQEKYSAPISPAYEELELRYAFADWGKIWGNPSIYLEWVRQHNGPQCFETKLLLTSMLSHEWYWGTNFAYEAELGGEFEHELGFSAGIAKLFDGKFSIGGEVRGEAELEKEGAELEAEELSAMAGPSFHVRLPGGMRLSLVPTAGIKYSDTSRAAYEVFLSFGRDN